MPVVVENARALPGTKFHYFRMGANTLDTGRLRHISYSVANWHSRNQRDCRRAGPTPCQP